MRTPAETYDYDMASRGRPWRKRQQIPAGHDPAAYVTTRIMATSHAGAQVPVSILHRRDFTRDGLSPLLLYGYGSDCTAIPSSFPATLPSLLHKGHFSPTYHLPLAPHNAR